MKQSIDLKQGKATRLFMILVIAIFLPVVSAVSAFAADNWTWGINAYIPKGPIPVPVGDEFICAIIKHGKYAGKKECRPIKTYFARAKYKSGLHIGKFSPEWGGAKIPYGWKEILIKKYEVFTGRCYDIEHAEGGKIPARAVRAGYEANGKPLYAALAEYQIGDKMDDDFARGKFPGKVRPAFRGAHIPVNGKEINVKRYFVLIEDIPWLPNSHGKDQPDKASLDLVWNAVNGTKPVIFIHGLNDGPWAWNDMLKALHSREYFEKVGYKGRTFFDRHAVWTFGWNSKNRYVRENAAKLYEFVKKEKINQKDLIIVTHSTGGVVARAYIAKGGNCKKLVTLGTPHWGSGMANWSLWGIKGKSCEDVKWGSDYLRKLEKNSRDRNYRKAGKYVMWSGEVAKKNFFQYVRDYPGDVKAASAAVGGNNDGTVPRKSAWFCWDDDEKTCYCHGDVYHTTWHHNALKEPGKAISIYSYILNDFIKPIAGSYVKGKRNSYAKY